MSLVLDGMEYLTIDQAAERLGTTILRVLMLIKRNVVQGIEMEGSWFISAGSIDCVRAHGKDMSFETGCRSHCQSNGCGCR